MDARQREAGNEWDWMKEVPLWTWMMIYIWGNRWLWLKVKAKNSVEQYKGNHCNATKKSTWRKCGEKSYWSTRAPDGQNEPRTRQTRLKHSQWSPIKTFKSQVEKCLPANVGRSLLNFVTKAIPKKEIKYPQKKNITEHPDDFESFDGRLFSDAVQRIISPWTRAKFLENQTKWLFYWDWI